MHIKMLFFSGGKDSFLTIQALVREYYSKNEESLSSFGLILLTTFDETTRNIAHQNVKIDEVIRHASHLNITLIGIPLRRGSGETYQVQIERGLTVIQQEFGVPDDDDHPTKKNITSLVFHDLLLEHIREWHDKTLNALFSSSCALEYALWKVDYSTLLKDLEASQVPCSISESTVDTVIAVGSMFDRALHETAKSQLPVVHRLGICHWH